MDSGDRNVKTIEQAMEERPLGWYQWRILFICFICLMVDGFDAQSLAYVAPVMRQELGISTSALGLIFSSSLIGMLFGAFLLSPLADKFGRRPLMISAMGICSVAMLLASATSSFSSLIVVRFVTGLGLGVILPNALALVSEFSPERHRSILVMLTSLGLSAGAAPGGMIAAALIPAYGWRSVFIFGGIASLVVTAIALSFLPESLRFLVEAGKAKSISAQRSLKNLFGHEASHVELLKKEKTQNWSSITALFSGGRRASTLLFWSVTFCNLLSLYFLANWLPVLLRDQGLDLESALLAASAMQAGGLPGVVSISYFSRKFGSASTLCVTYLTGAGAMALMHATVMHEKLLVILCAFVIGACVVGGQAGIQAIGIQLYPIRARATGMGWALGFGRLGAIFGPLLAGVLLSRGWSHARLFDVVACVGIIAAISVVFIRTNPAIKLNAGRHPVP